MSAILTMQQQGWEAYAGKLGADLMKKAQTRLAWICDHVQGDDVLKVDCGQAAALILLARSGKTVVGLCNDLAIHKQARQFVSQEPSQVQRSITLHQGNLDDTPTLIDHSFDTIILTECLVRANTPSDLIEIAYRKLKPEGTLITLWPVGVQDDPRARHTFFVREPARLLSRHFNTQEIRLLGDTIGFVSVARKKVLTRSPAATAWPDELVKELEIALQKAEQTIVDDLRAAQQQLQNSEVIHSDANDRLATLDKLQAQHESQATTLRAQLDSLLDAKKEAETAAQLRITELQNELQARRTAVDQASHTVAQVQAQSRILELEQVQQIAVLRHEKLERDMRIQSIEQRLADAQKDVAQTTATLSETVQTLNERNLVAETKKTQLEQRIIELEAIAARASNDVVIARNEAAHALQQATIASDTQKAQLAQRIQELEAVSTQAQSDAHIARVAAAQQLQEVNTAAETQRAQLAQRIQELEAVSAQALYDAQVARDAAAQQLQEVTTAAETQKTQLAQRIQELEAIAAQAAIEVHIARNEAAEKLQQLNAAAAIDKTRLEQNLKELEAIAEQALNDEQKARDEAARELQKIIAANELQRAQFEQKIKELQSTAEQALKEASSARETAAEQLQQFTAEAEAQKKQQTQRIEELEIIADKALLDAQTARDNADRELQAINAKAQTVQTQFEERIRSLNAELSEQNDTLDALRRESEQAKKLAAQQIQTVQQEKTTLEATLRDVKASREQLNKQHQQAQLSLKALDTQLLQTRKNSENTQAAAAEQARAFQSQLLNAESEANNVAAELKAAQLKYRDLLQQYRDTQGRERELEGNFRHLERRVRHLQHEKAQALHQVEQTRRSQSFRVGYTLLHAFKSWSAFSRLPADLLSIRRDVVAKRDIKGRKQAAQGIPVSAQNAPIIRTPAEPIMLVSSPAIEIGQQSTKTRIAAIMDEFTFHSYAPESELLQLRPETWQEEIEAFKPDLVFVESAWKGIEDLWARKVSNCTEEVRALLQWARDNKVPSMFWNKEDPVHFSTFIELASLVDHVFTTDVDCIPKYKKILGHNRVYLLPFAAQPATHNPIEIYDRKDAFNFAGSYYLRYPERQRDFAALIDTVQQFKPVDIYDRNYDKPHPHYQFPEKYGKYILGTLKFDEIDKAYKGYRYGINMNTIKQSQTMFARRVFELLASNTVVVSNFSRGVRLLFGDLVISSDHAAQIDSRIREICNDELTYRKFRLSGLRKVMAEHTYRHRLDYIKAKLSNTRYSTLVPGVAFVAIAKTASELQTLQEAIKRQSHPSCHVFVLTDAGNALPPSEKNQSSYYSSLNELIAAIRQRGQEFELLGLLHPDDYYGKHYAEDFAWAVTYAPETEAFGKATRYQNTEAGVKLADDGKQYHFTQTLPLRSSVIRFQNVSEQDLQAWLENPSQAVTKPCKTLALDEFNYVGNGAGLGADALAIAQDMTFSLSGVSFAHELAPLAESMAPATEIADSTSDDLPFISGPELEKLFIKPASTSIIINADQTKLRIQSRLAPEKHAYIYLSKAFRRDEVNLVLNSQFQLLCDDPGDVRTVFEFQDKDGKKISHSMMGAQGTHALAIPNECEFIRFGLKLTGRADIKIHKLVFGTHGETPAMIVGRSPILVLSKQYPAYDDLYKYGFLHTRIRAYQSGGHPVEVFRITTEATQRYREFENIDVASGDADLLRKTLASGNYKHVLTHILDTNMWKVLREFLDTIKVTVWIHGAEIQMWQRRAYEFVDITPEQITRKKKLSANRRTFWREVFATKSDNLKFVFVSNWLKESTEKDLDVLLTENQYLVIPNYVHTGIFPYREKTEVHQKKFLSIKSYASRMYANDVTADAIEKLASDPIFNELTFELCGDGEYFEKITDPLRKYSNVILTRKFFTHTEIAAKHADYGVFLTPTRMDTQGVSRDEAMSSGLVPISTDVGAVSEYLSSKEGYLCPYEDVDSLVEAIKAVVTDKDDYQQKSRLARERVEKTLNEQKTIDREVALFKILD